MVRHTPNGFEHLTISLYKAFLLFWGLTVLYRVIFYQNIFGIVITSILEISDSSTPHAHFKDKLFESIISFLAYSGNANITEIYKANRGVWGSGTTLSWLPLTTTGLAEPVANILVSGCMS